MTNLLNDKVLILDQVDLIKKIRKVFIDSQIAMQSVETHTITEFNDQHKYLSNKLQESLE